MARWNLGRAQHRRDRVDCLIIPLDDGCAAISSGTPARRYFCSDARPGPENYLRVDLVSEDPTRSLISTSVNTTPSILFSRVR